MTQANRKAYHVAVIFETVRGKIRADLYLLDADALNAIVRNPDIELLECQEIVLRSSDDVLVEISNICRQIRNEENHEERTTLQ